MRISDSNMNFMLNASLASNNVKLNNITEQITTQSRINRFSDDPIDAVKLESLNKQITQNEQYISNGQTVNSSLGRYETYAESLVELGNQINELLLMGSNETMDEEARAGIVTEVSALKDEMVQILNTQEEGSYIFSGTNSNTPAIDNSTGSYVITGNGESRTTAVGEGVTVQSNVTATDLLGSTTFLDDIDSALGEMKNSTADFRTVMEQAINSNQASLAKLQSGLSELGSRMNTVERQGSTNADVNFFADQVKLQLTNVDNAKAGYELAQAQVAIEMTQKTFVTISSSNMFDLI